MSMTAEEERLHKLLRLAEADRTESDDIRSAIVSAVSSMARDMENMVTQMIQWKAVVSAAREFVKDPSSVNALFALDEAVSSLQKPA